MTGVEVISCSFEKFLLFLKMCTSSNLTSPLLYSNQSDTDREEKKAGCESGFVQWYEIIEESIQLADKVDAVLNCLWLQWQQTPGEPDLLFPSKEYGLVLLVSVRAVVCVASYDAYFHLFSESSSSRARTRKASEGTEKWDLEQICVGPFFRPKYEKFSV